MKRKRCGLLALALLWMVTLHGGFAECGDTAQDRLVWARERMHPGLAQSQMREVYQWLLNSTSSCRDNGDLWYFRGLMAAKLSEERDASYAFRKAQENGSLAQQQKFDPFFTVDHRAAMPSGPSTRYALLVGINDFANVSDFLRYGAKDAKEMRDFLISSAGFEPGHITLLTNGQATTEKIREAFGDIRTKAKPEDMVLIYFSSHGKMRDLDPTGLSYVLTYDTDEKSAGTTFATSLQMVELAELGRWTQAKDYILLLDTCLSGAARAIVAGNDTAALSGLQGSGNRVVISASRASEKSYEDDATKHGYFTRSLLEALRQSPSLGSLGSVYDYVEAHVPTAVAKDLGAEQHPWMQVFGDGAAIRLNMQALSKQAKLPAQHARAVLPNTSSLPE
jgi:hypothetical protein